ncbi:NUMOD4 domain-containing protein [Halobacillus rhizosphaerae]|uniref:NUMOD4 domain-containing protein n=1 Tax=Halobacillus rhizosphaerae TaxID=3064889 RepID=UPI00398AD169
MNNYIVWKPVVGYEGIYEVSNTGLVRTSNNKTTYSIRHGKRVWKQRILRQKVSKDNCCRVCLWKNKEEKTFLVHRLVAFSFLPLIEGKEYVNHIDGNRLNNNLDNLEWCNHTENNNHAFDNKLIKTAITIKLVEIVSGKEYRFRSMAKASEFLGRNKGYLSDLLKKNKTETCGYKIIT